MLAGPNGALSSVSVRAADDVWAVGSVGATQLLVRWDGSSWRRLEPPRIDGESTLADVVALGAGSVWAVGARRTAQGDVPLAQRWDGARWSVVPVPGVRGRFHSVAWDGRSGVWAGGEDETGHPLLAHWSGGSWEVSRPPVPDPSGDTDARGPAAVWSLSHVPGTTRLWAVGSYARAAAPDVRHALTWTTAPG